MSAKVPAKNAASRSTCESRQALDLCTHAALLAADDDVDERAVLVAARHLFETTQAALRPLVGINLEPVQRRDLWRRHYHALRAVEALYRDVGGTARAKRLLADTVAPDPPLSICHGHLVNVFGAVPGVISDADAHGYHSGGDGCGFVYQLSRDVRGPLPLFCPACRARTSKRRRDRARSRAIAYANGLEEVVGSFGANGEPVLAWSGECRRCGHTFVNERPDAVDCGRCR